MRTKPAPRHGSAALAHGPALGAAHGVRHLTRSVRGGEWIRSLRTASRDRGAHPGGRSHAHSGRLLHVNGTRQRVLVIEDDADIRASLVEYLEDEGFEVAAAENGAVGLARLAAGPLPGVVLLDSAMPVLDGAGTLARLRA